MTSLVAQMLKRLPPMREMWVRSLGWEDSLEKEMATHSSILHWRIPWSEEPGRLQSTGSKKVGHDWVTSLTIVGLPGKSHRQRNLADYSPLDGRRVGYDLVTEQQQQIVVLQCCVSFWCIAKWLSYTHTHTHTRSF